jgi:hypothetical protein
MLESVGLDAMRIREIARSEFDAWIAAAPAPARARRILAPDATLRGATLARVEAVLNHPRPASANRRWICELLRAWAPLEVLFPTRDHRAVRGVSGEMPLHVALLVEREYGHVLGAVRSLSDAYELLREGRDRLSLQLAIAQALLPLLQETGADDLRWLEELRQMSLAMAEYLHRNAIGLAQTLPDDAVMIYAATIARAQRLQRDACQPVAAQRGA